jgi:hypothetical protein
MSSIRRKQGALSSTQRLSQAESFTSSQRATFCVQAGVFVLGSMGRSLSPSSGGAFDEKEEGEKESVVGEGSESCCVVGKKVKERGKKGS